MQENNKSKLNIGFFFLSLGSLAALITSVVAFLNLVFDTLNKRFPDVLNSTYQYGYYTYDYESIRMALAVLIVFFPVFLAVSYFWNRFSKAEMGSIDVLIRKWVIYIILFLSSGVIIGDLVTLLKYFLSGEITARFVWKVAITLAVALIIGAYYIFDLKGKTFKKGYIFSAASAVLVLAAIIWSFSVIGSPAKQRMLRIDSRRVSDLESIQYQVINYWQQKEKLPVSLDELSNPISSYAVPVDPEFEKGKAYEYAVKAPLTFELCADFALEMPKGWREGYGGAYPMRAFESKVMSAPAFPGGMNQSWDHKTGRTCFERTIDPDIYPPFEKPARK